MNWMRSKSLLLITVFTLLVAGCKVQYGFNLTSLPEDVKTVSVAFFTNNASIVQPTLSQVFTEKLKDKFITETNLGLVPANGDFAFSGEIVDYVVAPVSVQSGNTTASLNRLTISIKTKFVCEKHPELGFDQVFTNFQDFDASQDISAVEATLIDEITDMTVQDIFNKSAVNW